MKFSNLAGKFNLLSAAVLGCLAIVLAGESSAQTVHGPEQTYAYANVRNWQVMSLDERNGVKGCRASVNQSGRTMMIEQYHGHWNLIVPTRQTSTFAGGVVKIDNAVYDSQFGIFNGYAVYQLYSDMLGKLKAGSKVSVRVNGDPELAFSLKGSTAAILKVQECVKTGGEAPTQQANAQQAGPAPGETEQVTCETYTEGTYACTATIMKNEPGYEGVVRLVPVQGQNGNGFFVKFRQGVAVADVWFSTPGGQWKNLGAWDLTPRGDGFCAVPSANQTPAAQSALGQDAWQICAY